MRRGGRRLAPARARLFESGRARHGRAHEIRTRRPRPPDGARVPRFVRRSVADRPRRRLDVRVRRRPASLRRRARHGGRTRAHRQRPLRARLREVHPLLPVRRRVWRTVAAQLRDRHRRTRVRCSRLDRARRATSRLGVRVLRQLHPGVPDRRPDGGDRVRHARSGHVGRERADHRRHDLRLLRRRVRAHLHVQDNAIVKVTSPPDNPITHGNLCIKGRFGFQHAQNRPTP